RHLGEAIDRHSVGNDRIVVGRLPVAVEAIPQRNRDAEVALPGDQPVAVEVLHPVLVAREHERRVPFDLTSPSDELISQLCRPAAVADVPLAAGDDLEWLVTLLTERNGMGDRFYLADEVTGIDEHLRDFFARAEGGLAGQSLIVG